MRLKPSELKQLGPRALAQLHAQGIDPGGDVPDDLPTPKKVRKAPARPSVDLTGLSSFDGETLTIVLPELSRALSPNARIGHFALYHARKRLKADAWATAMEALGTHPGPMWAYASVSVTVYKRTRHREDTMDNRPAMLKPVWDALTAAGVWVDDSRGTMGGPIKLEHDPLRPRVEIRVREKNK